MKMLKYIIILMTFITLQSCSRHLVPSESISASSYSDYEISFYVITSGNNRAEAMKNASEKVFENIFYIGTPKSINNLPMLDANKSESKLFFSRFIDKEEYKPFITKILETSYSNTDNLSKKVKLETKIVVNIESLRRYLQREGTIRKFGY